MTSLLEKLAVFLLSYFMPISEMIHVMLIFLAVGAVSGVWASLKEGEKLQSNKLRRTVYKFLWYTIAVIISFMMERTFSLGWSNLSSIIAGFICFVEFKSILENITRITGDPLFMRILRIFRNRGKDTIRDIMDEDQPNQPINERNEDKTGKPQVY